MLEFSKFTLQSQAQFIRENNRFKTILSGHFFIQSANLPFGEMEGDCAVRNLFLFVLLAGLGAFAGATPVPEVNLSATVSHTSVPAGEELSITVNYAIPEKHHLTAHFFELVPDALNGFEFGLQQPSAGQYEEGEIVRRQRASIRIPVQVAPHAVPGEYNLSGKASYQICQEAPAFMCFPPSELPYSVTVTVVTPGTAAVQNPEASKTGETAGTATVSGDVSLEQRLQTALTDNLLVAFLLVFFFGFLTSLTPCVYPMIPITISYIGGRSAGQSRYKGFFLSLFYVLGLAIVYAFLGVFAAATGALFGAVTQTPWVRGFVSLVFGIMGISMLGVFDIQLPSSIQSRLQSGGPKSGFLGAIAMGMVAGLVAAPCAGPIIVALMTYIASTGNIILGFVLMMGFAAGMGILFIALGTFSGLLTSLPAAGLWMDKVKKIFGTVMIAVALYYAKPLMPPPVYGFLIGVGLLLLGAALGAFKPSAKDDPIHTDIRKAIAILSAVLGIYFAVNLVPIPGKIVPERSFDLTERRSGFEETMWRTDLETALKETEIQGKYAILDFGAEWCAACKELEHKTFPDTNVLQRLKTMTAIKVDCTNARDQAVKDVLSRFSVTGLPTVIILDSQGQELGRFTSFLPPEEFIKFLDQTLSSDTIEKE
jgi:thioredoxin:protein disulfide reductase